MKKIVMDVFDTYKENLKLILLFSIPFILAFLIPLLAPVPTYLSVGGIFLRTGSIFVNLTPFSIAVIVLSMFFSLLFLSFAFVAISILVKSKRTRVKTAKTILDGIEKYTGRVFVVLLLYATLLIAFDIYGYIIGMEGLVSIFGFFGFMLIFYAPSAIVVDNKGIWRAIKDSARLVLREPQYFITWLLLIVVVTSVLDFLVLNIFSIYYYSYIMLVINSLFVLPYFVIFQADAYMLRFPLLRH